MVEHRGEFYSFDPVYFEPKPVQKPGIPIEIGGASPGALRRAGTLGDGWIEIGAHSLDDVAAKIDTVMRHRKEAGREDLPFDITTGYGLAPDATSRERCVKMGVTRLITSPPFPEDGGGIRPEAAIDFIREFGQGVI